MPEFLELVWHAALHTLEETALLLPFLFLTYLLMEFLEHRAGDATERLLRGSGRVGPLLGGALGILPQCGFSVAASGLYTGRIITTGTLVAVYLSTSDEMLPLLISGGRDPLLILRLLGTKLLVGIAAGFCVDGVTALLRRRGIGGKEELAIEDLCERENCNCGERFWLSALKHTAYITLFLLAFGFVVNLIVEGVGEETIKALVLDRPVLSCLLAALVGLIPNCASSIALTSLYLEGVISVGAMLSGLFVNAGVGIAVLFRNNRPVKDSLRILLILLLISLGAGLLIDLTPLGAWIG